MRSACAEAIKSISGMQKPAAEHLRIVARAFVLLQQDRQTADYDNARKWTRWEALERIEIAAAAFKSWDVIVGEPISEDFLLQLLIQR
jgi:hypothetical protein